MTARRPLTLEREITHHSRTKQALERPGIQRDGVARGPN